MTIYPEKPLPSGAGHEKSGQDVHAIINASPYSIEVKSRLRGIAPELAALRDKTIWQLFSYRRQLGDLEHSAPNGQRKALVQGALYVLKRVRPEQHVTEVCLDNHPVSDHAFCAAVRRLGYDMKKYKDAALKEAIEHGLIPITKQNTILTFLPNPNNLPASNKA